MPPDLKRALNEPKQLPHVVALLSLLSVLLLLPLDDQDPVGKGYLDIFLVHATGQLGRDFVGPIRLGEMDSRDRTESRSCTSGRNVQERPPTGG